MTFKDLKDTKAMKGFFESLFFCDIGVNHNTNNMLCQCLLTNHVDRVCLRNMRELMLVPVRILKCCSLNYHIEYFYPGRGRLIFYLFKKM